MNNGRRSRSYIDPALRSYIERISSEGDQYFQIMQSTVRSSVAALASEYRYHNISSFDIIDAYGRLLLSACFSEQRLRQWHQQISAVLDSGSAPAMFYKLEQVKQLLAQLVVTVELAAPLEHPLSRLAIRDIGQLLDRYPMLVYVALDQWLKTVQLMAEDSAMGAIVNAVDLYKLVQRYSPGIKLDVLNEVYGMLYFICQSSWLELAKCAVLEEPEPEAEPAPDDLQVDLESALSEILCLEEQP